MPIRSNLTEKTNLSFSDNSIRNTDDLDFLKSQYERLLFAYKEEVKHSTFLSIQMEQS